MDDIDVTSSMGRDLPYVLQVGEAAKVLGFERTLALKRIASGGGAADRRAVRIPWSLRVLRGEPLKRFAAGCVARSFGVAAGRLSTGPVGSASVPRLQLPLVAEV